MNANVRGATASPVTATGPDARITPDDIRAKFSELQGEVDSTAEAAKSTALTVGAVVVTVVVLGVFLMGRRRGRKRTTVVEIRRV